jgi:hypothetical protein
MQVGELCVVLLIAAEHFRFLHKQKRNNVAREIVQDEGEIALAKRSLDAQRSCDIGMDEVQRPGRCDATTSRKRTTHCLRRHTRVAERGRGKSGRVTHTYMIEVIRSRR